MTSVLARGYEDDIAIMAPLPPLTFPLRVEEPSLPYRRPMPKPKSRPFFIEGRSPKFQDPADPIQVFAPVTIVCPGEDWARIFWSVIRKSARGFDPKTGRLLKGEG